MKNYDYSGYFYNGFAHVCLNNKYGFVNTLGEEICEIKYTDVCDFIDTVTWVSLDLSWGLINNKGEELCEFKYNDMTIFIAGFSKVEIYHDLGSYYGYVDNNGIEIIQCKYDSNTANILLQKYKLNLKRKSKIKSFLS